MFVSRCRTQGGNLRLGLPAQSTQWQASEQGGQEQGALPAHDCHQDDRFPQEWAADCNEIDVYMYYV